MMSLPKQRFIRAHVLSVAFSLLASPAAQGQSSEGIEPDLRHAEFCARAMREFRADSRWKDHVPPALSQEFTSHYNKRLHKCLVQVIEVVGLGDGVIENRWVYDAFENVVVGRKATIRSPHGADKVVVADQDDKVIAEPSARAAAVAAFDGLMKD